MTQSGSNDLSSKVKKWLEKQGYTLEMRVAQAFSQAGFEVSISKHYLDPKLDEIREIDVVASINREVSRKMSVSMDIHIECKYTSKPWVVFTSKKNLGDFSYFSRVLRGKYDIFRWESRPTLQARLVSKILSSLGRSNIKKHKPLLMPSSVGYRVTESLRDASDRRDPAYTALLQVTNSVRAHDIKVEDDYGRTLDEIKNQNYGVRGYDDLYIFASISIPVIFVRGKLFECFLNNEGNTELMEVKESVVMMSSKDIIDDVILGNSVENPVRIVTEDMLEDFVQKIFVAAKALLEQDDVINNVWQNERNRLPKTPNDDDIPF